MSAPVPSRKDFLAAECRYLRSIEESLLKEIAHKTASLDAIRAKFTEARAAVEACGEDERLTPADLFYSRSARCRACQRGLAYPKLGQPQAWQCSGEMLGEHQEHHEVFPFEFYSIGGERDDETTRPR